MSESASYIIVPPDDTTGGGFSLQDLIEGLQSGRLVLGSDNVVVNAQQQQDEASGDQPQQLVFSLPEAEPEPEPEPSTAATVAEDNTQEPAEVNNCSGTFFFFLLQCIVRHQIVDVLSHPCPLHR